MEGFRSTDMLSCRDNGSGPPRCVLPAPRPPRSPSLYLPLSRNTRHILLQTTPPAKSSLPAPRLFSFAPTLLPSRALTAHLTVKRHRDAPAAPGAVKIPLTSTLSDSLELEAVFKACTHRTLLPLSLLFPPAQIQSDSENTCENTRVLF